MNPYMDSITQTYSYALAMATGIVEPEVLSDKWQEGVSSAKTGCSWILFVQFRPVS